MKIEKLLDFIGWTFLIVAILLLKFSERLLDNIIRAKSFLTEFAIYGVIISAVILYLIYKTNPNYFKGGEKRASAVLSYFFGIIALFVFGGAYYNLQTAKKNTKNLKVFVSGKSKNTRYGTTYLT